ncbi:HupE/UreJ family protein [soil metagenome]
MKRTVTQALTFGTACLAFAHQASAHHLPPGFEDIDEFEQAQMLIALRHPFTGLDHLLLALAMGWIACLWGKRIGTALFASFIGSMLAGLILGRLGLGVPMLEEGLALSVIASGLVLAYASKASTKVAFTLAIMAGFWHGNAHGVEMPGAAASLVYGAGLLFGTATVACGGMTLAALATQRRELLAQGAGVVLALAGVWLWLA